MCMLRERAGAFVNNPDAGQSIFFLFLFRLRTVRTSKFSASRLWRRTDRCLMPWRYFMLYAAALAGTFWGFRGFAWRQTVCPKSWLSGRKLRISNCSPESQKKEKVSPPGWYRKYFTYLSGSHFSDVFSLASG